VTIDDLIWAEKVTLRSPKEALDNMKKIVDAKTGIVRALVEQARRNDERKLFTYIAWMCNTSQFSDINVQRFTNGVSLNRDMAMIQALGEAIERYCLSIYRKDEFLMASSRDLGNQALDPTTIVNFSERQIAQPRFKYFRYTEDTPFRWVQGYSLTQQKPIYLPAQLIYFYDYTYDLTTTRDEPIIRFPDTNGSAPWMSLAGALRHGICEIIERDANMITWLNRLQCQRVNIESSQNEYLIKLQNIHDRYGFDLYVYDITMDIPVPTMLAIVLDRSGVGPSVVVGTASNFDPETAIIKAIEDAKVGSDLRDAVLKNPNLDLTQIRNPSLAHGLFWWGRDKIHHLDFLLHNEKMIDIQDIPNQASNDVRKELTQLLEYFAGQQMEVAYVDVTTPDVYHNLGFRVVKVIIPELHPIHLLEQFRYLGGRRLYQVPRLLGYTKRDSEENELNRIPHPFV
jgi:ribosomal protein S12 methylthiotransferase accessory factor